MTQGNPLGACGQCHAALCTKGDAICCTVCGLPAAGHPLALPAKPPAPPRPAARAAKPKAA